MLTSSSHFEGVLQSGEVLFETDFGYIFNYLSCNEDCLLPVGQTTITGLLTLGSAMVMEDPGTVGNELPEYLSDIPAIYTYLGQFIDHDITARTDRETTVSQISDSSGNVAAGLAPVSPDEVVSALRNGRRPQLDLDSVFGDGPHFPTLAPSASYETEADPIYNAASWDIWLGYSGAYNGKDRFDLQRKEDKTAVIGDARNDENMILSQLHTGFIMAFNKIKSMLTTGTDAEKYIKARRLLTWAYQYIVVNDYLPHVCTPTVVKDTVENGPYFFLTHKGIFMPLEFSIAGFRFGHSMIRPFYQINNDLGDVTIDGLLGATFRENYFTPGYWQLAPENTIDWTKFVGSGAQKTRKIDWRLAQGLFNLSAFEPTIPMNTMFARLSQRNLLRGYSLSVPTGQAVAGAMGINPMTETEVLQDLPAASLTDIEAAGFGTRTPLWFYILKEASIQSDGNRLGVVGSRLVSETLVGMIKADPNSYLNNQHATEVTDSGIVLGSTTIATIEDLLTFAGAI